MSLITEKTNLCSIAYLCHLIDKGHIEYVSCYINKSDHYHYPHDFNVNNYKKYSRADNFAYCLLHNYPLPTLVFKRVSNDVIKTYDYTCRFDEYLTVMYGLYLCGLFKDKKELFISPRWPLFIYDESMIKEEEFEMFNTYIKEVI